jgi:UDP-N-acetylmuramate dehydrogenase
MNAGAYNSELKDILASVTIINSDGALQELQRENLHFGYRRSFLPKDSIVTNVTLRLKAGDKEKIEEQISSNLQRRKKNQPGGYSAGSVFKNPAGNFAGRLIEECGLKGHKIGGVTVSVKHANFFLNDGTGSASQMLELITLVKNIVKEKTGITLEEEVRIVGI